MKLILNVEVAKNEFVNVEILDSTIEEIDEFTTCFSSKKELFDKIIKSGEPIEYDFSKYDIFIRTIKKSMIPVLYSDYSFITDSLKRRNASIIIMKSDPHRVYTFLENNHYNYLLKDMPLDADKKYSYDLLYKLARLIEEKNYRADGSYYNFFKKNIEGNYSTLRDMIKEMLTDDEKAKLNSNTSVSNRKVNYLCTKANLNLNKSINEKLEEIFGRKYSICHEDDDVDE